MDRKQIKELAKSKIKGNLWNLLWPVILISVVSGLLSSLFGPSFSVNLAEEQELANMTTFSPIHSIGSFVVAILSAVATAGYMKYCLNFVRTGKFKTDDIINTIKAKWLDLLIANVLGSLIIGLGYVFLVIPGIIAAIGLAMINFLIIDKNTKGPDSIKASWELMKGHKGEYFVLMLSFIGWLILVPFTLGLLLIWLIPYMNIAKTIYYDQLTEKKN